MSITPEEVKHYMQMVDDDKLDLSDLPKEKQEHILMRLKRAQYASKSVEQANTRIARIKKEEERLEKGATPIPKRKRETNGGRKSRKGNLKKRKITRRRI